MASSRLWGRCPNFHPWFPIDEPDLDASFLCPVCLSRAEQVRETRLRIFRRRRTRDVG